MHKFKLAMTATVAAALCAAAGAALAQSSVGYGRITAVNRVDVPSAGAQGGGALLGGAIGMVSGRNQSRSNQALRAGAGAFAGNRLAQGASGGQAFEYTILQGGRTTTIVTSEGGLRVGDCVSVERGGFNNLRLVDDARCAPGAAAPQAADRRLADACVAAKDSLMRAETDEAFDRAERRVRLQCQD
jgi:hypothetical protein